VSHAGAADVELDRAVEAIERLDAVEQFLVVFAPMESIG
jgi:hypothetical protein